VLRINVMGDIRGHSIFVEFNVGYDFEPSLPKAEGETARPREKVNNIHTKAALKIGA